MHNMDGFFVAKLKKFAPGERKATSSTSRAPDKDAPEANEVASPADGMEVDFRYILSWLPFCILVVRPLRGSLRILTRMFAVLSFCFLNCCVLAVL